MAKHYKDPWKKKSSQGLKAFNNIVSTSIKAGALLTKEASKSQIITKNEKNINTEQSKSSQYNENDWVIAFSIFAIFGVILLIITALGIKSIFVYIIILLIAVFVLTFVGVLRGNSNKEKIQLSKELKNNNLLELNEDEKTIMLKIKEIIVNGTEKDIENTISLINNVNSKSEKKILITTYDNTVEEFLVDKQLSIDEENKLEKYQKVFNLSQSDLDLNKSYTKVIQSSILSSLKNNIIPKSRIKITEGLSPFLLNKNEVMLWVYTNVAVFENIIKKTYIGSSNGVSMKIVDGLYYRTTSFKGEPISVRELRYVTSGILGFTSKNIHFYSSYSSFKIPITKIVSLNPYEDGIIIHKDGVNSKPIILKNLDGLFVYNLITSLNNI